MVQLNLSTPTPINRTMYAGYYLKQLNRPAYRRFLLYASEVTGRSKYALQTDMLQSIYRYNISLLEYFQFRFYQKRPDERSTWAGTGYMYEYQLLMNPKDKRKILDDKTIFFKYYQPYIVHVIADREMLEDRGTIYELLHNRSGKIVFKAANGKCGNGVVIRPASEFTSSSLKEFMHQGGYDLAEAFIIQHPEINRLSPSAVNTVRIFTQLNQLNEVELLGSRLRISVNSQVDNMAAGNLAAPIDEETGIVSGPGVYSDITKADEHHHPVTGVEIPGFEIPWWKEMVKMVKEAQLFNLQNRSIGWDIVVTENGPGFIEGNHDWCKLLWQLPVKQGLKHKLEPHLKAFKNRIHA